MSSQNTASVFDKAGVTIREYKDADAVEIKKLVFGIFDEFNLARLKQFYAKSVEECQKELTGANEERRIAYVIQKRQHDGDAHASIVGCVILVQQDANDARGAELSKFYLAPELRGKGLGKALLADVIAKAKLLGYERIFLMTRVEFVAAVQLYNKVGFKPIPNPLYDSPRSLTFQIQLASV